MFFSRFLHCSESDLKQYVDMVEDETLRETLSSGVAFTHEGLSKKDLSIVQQLFDAGAVQVSYIQVLLFEAEKITNNTVKN